MAEDEHGNGGEQDKKLLPSTEEAFGKKRLPHKFCPYCGHRNEALAERCENCGKDISWMRIPEPSNRIENPPLKPKPIGKTFSRRTAIILGIILLLIALALVLIIAFGNKSKGSEKTGSAVKVEAILATPGLALRVEPALREPDALAAEPPAAAGVVVKPGLVIDALHIQLIYEGPLPALT
jgi:hypothetical protein